MPAIFWLALATVALLGKVAYDVWRINRDARNWSAIEQERVAREHIYGPENRWPLR